MGPPWLSVHLEYMLYILSNSPCVTGPLALTPLLQFFSFWTHFQVDLNLQRREASGNGSRASDPGVGWEEGCLGRRGHVPRGQVLPGGVGFS